MLLYYFYTPLFFILRHVLIFKKIADSYVAITTRIYIEKKLLSFLKETFVCKKREKIVLPMCKGGGKL